MVYQFNCNEDSCQASYLGYSTNTLLTRCKQHKYFPSSIYKHYNYEHNKTPPTADALINNFKILYKDNNTINLKIAEAIHIKERNPFINVKYNEATTILNLF